MVVPLVTPGRIILSTVFWYTAMPDVRPDYLVMEYIEGTALKGPLPLDQVLKYAGQICDALDAAHKKGLALEARHALRVARKRFRQDLERHVALQLGIPRAVYLPHPSRAEGCEDFVRAEFGASGNGHACR